MALVLHTQAVIYTTLFKLHSSTYAPPSQNALLHRHQHKVTLTAFSAESLLGESAHI